MKSMKTFALAFVVVVCLLACNSSGTAQPTRLYQQMTAAERANFVSAKAQEIGRRLSESDYQFTASFETKIQASLDSYVQRLDGRRPGVTSPQVVIERGQSQAPTIMSTFKTRGVSPLIGLYIPWIESEYNNEASSQMGAVGMFQFLPKTGSLLGLTSEDLLDVGKSSDAAARYIANSMKVFGADQMKELLAVLAYNRGDQSVRNEVALMVNDKNNGCSICALAEQQEKPNQTLSAENVYYVPRFIAAAILGENPQAFGLNSPPLSSFGTGH